MAEINVMNGGIEELNVLKTKVNELASNRSLALESENGAEQTEKAIKAKEKAINDEIAASLKKRKGEIESSFDSEYNKVEARQKKVKANKEKSKGKMVNQRIENETTELRETYREHKQSIKTLLKKNKMSGAYDSKFFYALYMPNCFSEILIVIISILVTMVALPSVVFLYIIPDEWVNYFAFTVIYLICAVVFLGGYLLIGMLTKDKHREVFAEIKNIRTQLRLDKKQIALKKKVIKGDKDESTYSLENFDSEMETLENELSKILEAKNASIKEYETNAKIMITNEIKDRARTELDELHDTYNKYYEQQRMAEDKAKDLALEISLNYETYLGRNFTTLENIDLMLTKLENGEAATIGEALAAIKAGTDSTKSSEQAVIEPIGEPVTESVAEPAAESPAEPVPESNNESEENASEENASEGGTN